MPNGEDKSLLTRFLLYIAKYIVPLLVAATPVIVVMLNNHNNIDKGKKESKYYAGYLLVKVDTLNNQVAILQDSVIILSLANEQLNGALAKTEVWRWQAERRIATIEGKLSSSNSGPGTILGMWNSNNDNR
jgi:hypothetical protein